MGVHYTNKCKMAWVVFEDFHFMNFIVEREKKSQWSSFTAKIASEQYQKLYWATVE